MMAPSVALCAGVIVSSFSYLPAPDHFPCWRSHSITPRMVTAAVSRKSLLIVGFSLKAYFSRNTFIFHEAPYLALCPIHFILTAAFAYQAFDPPELNTPERFYSLRVEPGLKSRPIPWNSSIRDKPLFRSAEWTPNGWRMSESPLAYRVLLKYVTNTCRAAHWQDVITTYALRRSTGNAVDSTYP